MLQTSAVILCSVLPSVALSDFWVVDLSTLIVSFSVVMSVCWVVDLSTLIVRFSVVMSVCLSRPVLR